MTLDERAMEIYLSGKCTLEQAYTEAKFERGGAEGVEEILKNLMRRK